MKKFLGKHLNNSLDYIKEHSDEIVVSCILGVGMSFVYAAYYRAGAKAMLKMMVEAAEEMAKTAA